MNRQIYGLPWGFISIRIIRSTTPKLVQPMCISLITQYITVIYKTTDRYSRLHHTASVPLLHILTHTLRG